MKPNTDAAIRVRDAEQGDLDVIVEFNLELALETERKALDLNVLREGVRAGLNRPERLRYWVATSGEDGAVVGQAAITLEWSDWRNGWIWWFQSVYVRRDARGQGVFRRLHETIRKAALDAGNVVGLRLYVEEANEKAQTTYQALGLNHGGYHVYEEIWPERFGGLLNAEPRSISR